MIRLIEAYISFSHKIFCYFITWFLIEWVSHKSFTLNLYKLGKYGESFVRRRLFYLPTIKNNEWIFVCYYAWFPSLTFVNLLDFCDEAKKSKKLTSNTPLSFIFYRHRKNVRFHIITITQNLTRNVIFFKFLLNFYEILNEDNVFVVLLNKTFPCKQNTVTLFLPVQRPLKN